MASRRLAISSLLCDDDDASNKQEPRDDRLTEPPAVVHQPAARPYASPVRSAFHPAQIPSPTSSLLHSAHYEQQYHRQVYEPSPSPPGLIPYAPSRSITPLPLALQPVALQRRTPSPPPMSASPEPPAALTSYDRYIDDGQMPSTVRYRDSSDFPSRHSGVAQQQHSNVSHSPSYLQYEQPTSPSSPVNIQRPIQPGRRDVLHMSSYDYARTQSQITNSPPLRRTHYPSKSPEMATFSPSHSLESLRSQHLTSYSDVEERNAPYIQQNNYSAYRYSASVSPTIPKSAGISGLDVLSQAATEVRERIDETRRLSGGGDARFSLGASRTSETVSEGRDYSHGRVNGGESHSCMPAAVHQQAHSPVAFRSDVRLQPASPIPSPRSAPVVPACASSAHPSSPVDFELSDYSPHRAPKRRLSAEIAMSGTELRQTESPQGAQIRMSSHSNAPSRAPTRVVSDPEKLESKQSRITHKHAYELESSPDDIDYSHKPEANRDAMQPQVVHQAEVRHANDVKSPSSSRTPSGTGPPSRAPMPTGRRSPPRSRPKPKKPGSAALASIEQTSVEPSLKPIESERVTAVKSGSSVQTSTKSKRPSSKVIPASVGKQEEDEESTKFFLSAVSSSKVAQPAKAVAHEAILSSSQPKQPGSQQRKPWVKRARDSPLRIEIRRSPTSDILDEIIGSPDAEEKANSHTGFNNNKSSAYMDDIDNELASAVGATPSGDEGQAHVAYSENEDPVSDAMEVDVDNELLSLLDDPSEAAPRHVNATPYPTHSTKNMATNLAAPAALDRSSMPPPDVLNAKSGKKDGAKGKGKAKVGSDAVSGPSKVTSQMSVDETVEKVSKTKAPAKSRPPKASATTEKTKQSKVMKDISGPISSNQRGTSVDPSGSGTPVDESFPLVTSSGRMVTKSKKVAAAAAAATSSHGTSHSKKKAGAAPAVHPEASESRSRSHSVMPRASVDPENQREKSTKEEEPKSKVPEEADVDEDDKLYCICKTRYDEDRVMIACDRCDEWYHTQCINMPDLDIDLVDQFICPLCVERNPSLHLQTTYKQRCHAGLHHPKPSSADACHKPSRGAFSKYCSDECGVKFMHRKVQAWSSKGGDVQSLWAAVKDAKRREGVVTAEPDRTIPRSILAVLQNGGNGSAVKPQDNISSLEATFESTPTRDETTNTKLIKTLETQLESISRQRELSKKEMELINWRERLLILAADRANKVKECGWDQRMCFGDEEIMEFGESVLDSYEEPSASPKDDGGKGMDVDEQAGEGEWWCRGKQKCERHAGWQKLRITEIKVEKQAKGEDLSRLNLRERDIRRRIEDILHPQTTVTNATTASKLTFKPVNGRKGSDDGPKRGKKKSISAQ